MFKVKLIKLNSRPRGAEKLSNEAISMDFTGKEKWQIEFEASIAGNPNELLDGNDIENFKAEVTRYQIILGYGAARTNKGQFLETMRDRTALV
jgi:hypothetical protein